MSTLSNTRRPLLTVYDTIFAFGATRWSRVDWTQRFDPLGNRGAIEKRLKRLEEFCERWGIPLERHEVEEADGGTVIFRRFTPASKRRVDHLLGPVVQEPDPFHEDFLQSVLESVTPQLQGRPRRRLRNARLGEEA